MIPFTTKRKMFGNFIKKEKNTYNKAKMLWSHKINYKGKHFKIQNNFKNNPALENFIQITLKKNHQKF